MGFSRQEYWSGLRVLSPGDLPNPGTEPGYLISPALQVDSLLAEPPGKPKDNGVGSLFLPQRFFPTQELNWGLGSDGKASACNVGDPGSIPG